MNPAALRALLEGDMQNAIIASTPGGIEAQEAQGQRDFVASETLPRCLRCTRRQLESMGIKFGDPVDDLFVEVQLPKGWKKARTDHSMWSELHDEKGRKRASIFYKAAFYDRSAHIGLARRFSYRVEPSCGFGELHRGDNRHRAEWSVGIYDYTGMVWESTEILGPEPPDENRNELRRWYEKKDALRGQGRDWLDEHYPDWENPLAYWDEG